MRNVLKAVGFFALMVVAPFAFERLLEGHHKLRGMFFGFNSLDAPVVFGAIAVFLIAIFVTKNSLGDLISEIDKISKNLGTAERYLNSLLQAKERRKKEGDEKIEWAGIIPADAARREELLDLLREDFDGPAVAARKARMMASLLGKLYEGDVRTAEEKIRSNKIPLDASGLSGLLGVDWFPLVMAVKLHGHPRHIIWIKSDKTVLENWAVIDELTKPFS